MIGSEPSYKNDIFVEMSVWKEIYSRKIISDTNIRFCSERKFISEDTIFHLDYLICVKRISNIVETIYYYCANGNSLTTSYKPDRFKMEKILYLEAKRKLNEIEMYNYAYLRLKRTFLGRAKICIYHKVFYNKKINNAKKISIEYVVIAKK